MAVYLDTSALVKLVVDEDESKSLKRWLVRLKEPIVACDLARTELFRAVRRADPSLLVGARGVLESLTLVRVSTAMCDAAGRLEPATLRTLDAIHLAAALDLGDELEALVTYDDRLAEAAVLNGLNVVAPS